jgi:hypothetical protein
VKSHGESWLGCPDASSGVSSGGGGLGVPSREYAGGGSSRPSVGCSLIVPCTSCCSRVTAIDRPVRSSADYGGGIDLVSALLLTSVEATW